MLNNLLFNTNNFLHYEDNIKKVVIMYNHDKVVNEFNDLKKLNYL